MSGGGIRTHDDATENTYEGGGKPKGDYARANQARPGGGQPPAWTWRPAGVRGAAQESDSPRGTPGAGGGRTQARAINAPARERCCGCFSITNGNSAEAR